MSELAEYETCRCAERRDDDDRPMAPDTVTCGTCGWSWCMRCHPCPSARSWCEGSDRHRLMAALQAGDFLEAARLVGALAEVTVGGDDVMPCGCDSGSCYCDGESGVRA
jgi:hypothetical protein